MAAFYQKFLRRHLDLSSLSVMRREDNDPYFCTPKGASIFGWAGVDGIHFCFVRGFGETVFAVSPMNGGKDCVHVIARDFSDFLCLLLATGDSAALEQAWQWDEAQFDAFLAENPPTDEQKAVLSQISTVFSLTPMERPWQYLRKLQAEFDLSKLKFTEDFYDPEMNPDAPEQKTDWKVYFDGSFWGHHGRERAGREVPVQKWFSWAGRDWFVPSVYVCSKGIVVDFCMRTEASALRGFMKSGDRSRKRRVHRLLARRTRTDGARAPAQPRFYPQPHLERCEAPHEPRLRRHFPAGAARLLRRRRARHGALRP